VQSVKVPDLSALVGSTVTQVTLDEYQLTLLFFDAAPDRSTRVSAHLVIEKAFELEASGEVFEIGPQRCETLGSAWRFLKRTVASAEATDDLVVDVWFDDQSHFTLRPGGPYEAFNMWGDGVPGLLAGPS
jgi:hypothetical protein